MMRRFLFTTLLLAAAALPQVAGAQESRGSGEIGRPADKEGDVPSGRLVFGGIGIDAY
jgi:hypothetical protein